MRVTSVTSTRVSPGTGRYLEEWYGRAKESVPSEEEGDTFGGPALAAQRGPGTARSRSVAHGLESRNRGIGIRLDASLSCRSPR